VSYYVQDRGQTTKGAPQGASRTVQDMIVQIAEQGDSRLNAVREIGLLSRARSLQLCCRKVAPVKRRVQAFKRDACIPGFCVRQLQTAARAVSATGK
jgi:hypothetical protein